MAKKHLYVRVMIVATSLLGTMFFMQNCGQSVNFKETSLAIASSTSDLPQSTSDMPTIQALAYGSDSEDRDLLAKKIAGYQAPGIAEIFNRWKRFSGGTLYNSAMDIIPDSSVAYCFTSIGSNGSWISSVDPATNKSIDPNTYSKCIASIPFCAASWTYMSSSNRLRNAANVDKYTGFISAVPFDRYINQAVVTSASTDDDTIALIIAAKVDANGDLHTLSAARTQGSNVSPPTLGWGVVYRKNNSVVRVFNEQSVGGTNSNGTLNDNGDKKGWNGRMTIIRVEREGDKIVASTSGWGTSTASLNLDPTSKISLDLSDPSLELGVFKGPQFYGYGSQSQAGAEFVTISFSTTTDQKRAYDLVNDLVYEQQGDGQFTVKGGVSAFQELGYPRSVINPETQKSFHLSSDRSFTLNP